MHSKRLLKLMLVWIVAVALVALYAAKGPINTAASQGPDAGKQGQAGDGSSTSDGAQVGAATAGFSGGPVICSAPALAIPDNVPAGVTDSMIVGGTSLNIDDVNVLLNVTHTWVGDLKFTLENQTAGISITLIHRPGVPATTNGCSADNIDTELDDEGPDGPVENMCGSNPAIFGSPTPDQALAAFDGVPADGTWNLTVSDHANLDLGTLNEWCLNITGTPPQISVDPLSLASRLAQGTAATYPLTISNLGGSDLTWALTETASLNSPPIPAPAVPPAAGTAGGSLTDMELSALAPAPPLAPPPADGPASAPAGGLTYYNSRAAFETTYPGLPLEDFNDTLIGPGTITGCPAPFDSTTDNNCFEPGSIIPGVHFQDNPLNGTGGGSANGLAVVGTGASGNASPTIVANTFVDMFEIVFDPPGAYAAGMDLVDYVSSQTVDIVVYDLGGAMLGSTTGSATNNEGSFFGVASDTPIGRITIEAPNSAGDGAEGVDNFSFSTCNIEDLPWLSVSPASGTTAPGSASTVDVTFDATGMGSGTYTGALCIQSNDPMQPVINVPVTLTVDNSLYLPAIIHQPSASAANTPSGVAVVPLAVIGLAVVIPAAVRRRRS